MAVAVGAARAPRGRARPLRLAHRARPRRRAGGRRDPRQRRLPLGAAASRRCSSAACCSSTAATTPSPPSARVIVARRRARARAALAGDGLRSGRPRAPSAPARRCPTSSLLALVALVAVAALSTLGALLATALLVVPAATTRLVCSRLRPWQLATVALVAVEGVGGAVAVGAGQRAARAGHRRARRRRLRRRRRAAACSPRAAPAAAAVAAARARAARRRAAATAAARPAPGQAKVVATTTQIGDFARAVGGDRAKVVQILKPNTDPARLRAAALGRARDGRRRRRAAQRRRARPLDGRRGRGRPAATRRSSTSARGVPVKLAGRERAAPRPRATTRTGGTTRATREAAVARDPRRADEGQPRRRATSTRATPPPTWPGCARSTAGSRACMARVPAGAAQARHRPRRLRLLRPPLRRSRVVGAVIPSQTHAGPAVGRRRRAADAAHPPRGRQGGLPRELDQRQARAGHRAPDRARRATTRSTATRSGPRARSGATYLDDGARQRRRDGARLHRAERGDARSPGI